MEPIELNAFRLGALWRVVSDGGGGGGRGGGGGGGGGRGEEVGGKYEVSRMASQSSLPSAGEAFLIKGL